MISFLASPVIRWVGAFLLALAVLGGCYVKGRLDENKKLVAYKAEVAAAAKAQQDKIDSLVVRQGQITKKAEANHAKSRAIISSAYAALRLRSPASGSGVSEVPDPATKPAEAAAYYVSVAPELAEQCAQTTQQLTDLQEWTVDQGAAQ